MNKMDEMSVNELILRRVHYSDPGHWSVGELAENLSNKESMGDKESNADAIRKLQQEGRITPGDNKLKIVVDPEVAIWDGPTHILQVFPTTNPLVAIFDSEEAKKMWDVPVMGWALTIGPCRIEGCDALEREVDPFIVTPDGGMLADSYVKEHPFLNISDYWVTSLEDEDEYDDVCIACREAEAR